MRDIKCRGKRIGDGIWIHGYYVKWETRQRCPIGDDELSDDEIVHLIVRDGFADWNMPRSLEFTKVDKETLCQYTGLKDKNGVEIYEGDKIMSRNFPENILVVAFEKVSFVGKSITGLSSVSDLGYLKISEYEVVGDIYDNE